MANRFAFRLLGSGAVRVLLHRGGPSQVVELDGRLLLFDCGRCAVHNLVRFGYRVEDVDHVFLTHLHFDHICDLAYLVLLAWNNGRRERLRIFGPKGLGDFLQHALHGAYRQDIESRLAHGKDPAGLDVDVVEIDGSGPPYHLAGASISALSTAHAGMRNLNYCVEAHGKRVVITSDTQPDERLIPFCRDADLLVCECSGTQDFLSQQPWGGWHMTPEKVADLALGANVRRVVLKHFVIENFTDDSSISAEMVAQIKETYHGKVVAGHDGWFTDLMEPDGSTAPC